MTEEGRPANSDPIMRRGAAPRRLTKRSRARDGQPTPPKLAAATGESMVCKIKASDIMNAQTLVIL